MRSFLYLAFLTTALVASAAAPAAGRLAIEVQAGNWGDASVRDIQAVLDSVADVLAPHFPRHASARVAVLHSKTGPRVRARKSADGAHVVLLNVQDRRWDQLAYQFSHELCHIFSNYDQRRIGNDQATREHQWFEETLCETVSLVALNRLTARWKSSPPRAGWEDYAPAFGEYAARLLNGEQRRAPATESLAGWYARHRSALEVNPYLREKNEKVAASLVALFESSPESLESLGYLIIDVPPKPGFAAYLAAWYECCPEERRPFVRHLISLLTIS